MSKLTRRDFLKFMGIGTAGAASMLALAGCAKDDAGTTGGETTGGTTETDGPKLDGKEQVINEIDKDSVDPSIYTNAAGQTVIRVALDSDLGTLDPWQSGSAAGRNQSITNTTHETPIYQNKNRAYDLLMIKEWSENKELSTDEKAVYDVVMNDYIHDSEGNPVKAADLMYGWTQAKANGAANGLKEVESWEETGEYTFRVFLKNWNVNGIESALSAVKTATIKAYEECGGQMNTTLVATGPYIVKEWVVGSKLIIEADPNYWGKEFDYRHNKQNVDVIEYYIIKEAAQKAIALETDVVDIDGALASSAATGFISGETEGFTVFPIENGMCQTLFFNCHETAVTNDINLRKACMYAIDTQGVIDGALDGYGVPCCAFAKPEALYYNPAWETYEGNYYYDPELAKEYLEKSNYDGKYKLRIMSNNTDMKVKICQVIQQFLLQVGIQSEICSYEDALFTTYRFDETQWEIELDNTVATRNCATTFNNKWSYRRYDNDHNAFCLHNEEYQALIDTMIDVRTCSQEAVDAVHYYTIDNAYWFGFLADVQLSVGRSDKVVSTNYSDTSMLCAHTSTYVWNL